MRKNEKRKVGIGLVILVITIFISISLCFSFVSAVNIGVSPAKVSFSNVLRGGYAQRNIIVSSDSLSNIGILLTKRGEISGWLNFSSNNFNVSRTNQGIIEISVSPPRDIPNGIYTGFVTLETGSFGEGVEEHAVGVVKSVLDLFIEVEITDIQSISCEASEFKVSSAEKGDKIKFRLDILNTGNIRINPKIAVSIWDQDQITIIKELDYRAGDVFPTLKKAVEFAGDLDSLNVGQYWAEVKVVDCYASSLLTFDLFEPGALRANGELVALSTKGIAGVGEIVPIKAVFKNLGEKEVNAKFLGKISTGGNIIQLLESEEANVPIGTTSDFNFYFTPSKAGKYVVSGRIFYGNKKTFELSSVIEAFSEGSIFKKILIPALYVFIIAGIFFLIYKIRKERKHYFFQKRSLRWIN